MSVSGLTECHDYRWARVAGSLSWFQKSPRLRARATNANRPHRGSTGRWSAHPDPGIIPFCLVRPTSLTGSVNLSPSPKSATNFPCLAGEPFLAGQIVVRFWRRHFLRKCGRLTARFRAVGRALPSPTLFRRIHAYSVRSGGRGAAHRRKGARSLTRVTLIEEATNGTEV